MSRLFIFLAIILPLNCLAQVNISGRILNQADTRPVANASVFLSNATIGDKTAADGTFTLHNVNAGKYELIVSIIGFETFKQTITVGYKDIVLPDITIFPKTISLSQVTIKPRDDPDLAKYYLLFKEAFIGTSDLASDCKILNPHVLDFDYNEAKNTLKATSYDFLEIENAALGYKIRYLLTDFTLDNTAKTLFYKGSVFFENMKGTAAQQERWQRRRQEAYIGSEMHFIRSALGDRIEQEGFRVQQLAKWANRERPADNIIEAKIKYYKELKAKTDIQRDSLAFWVKKSKLPKTFQKLMPHALTKQDLIRKTDQPGQYAMGCEGDGLYIAYSKTHHFHITDNAEYLDRPINTETSLISFSEPYAFFYSNGVIVNPYGIILGGIWGREGVAELLPVDYDMPQNLQAPVDSTMVRNIAAKLKTFSENHIAEKAYLHFDKPYYAAGDTMYFKAYLTAGESHLPSTISSVLHVDLVNTGNKVDQSINLQVTDGVAWGDFALPDSLPKGNYRVRAYTRWMLNGTEGYFDQTIPVGSIRPDKTPESYVASAKKENKPDVQFFPEGGRLVNGISSKIAFKAIGSNSLGIDIKGEVVDNENRTVSTFASEHLGMGYFYLQPAAGKSYKAKINYPDGSQDIIDLPAADTRGMVLTVNNDSKTQLKIAIAATEAFYKENKNKDYALVIYSAGEASSFICKLDSELVMLEIPKQTLHTGIAPVTLFNPTGEPLCERLVFIQNNDQLNVGVSSDKQVYAKREKVSIKLDVKNSLANASAGHFSVAIIDESKVPVNENTENTILTNLLLTSDLKGYVEQPNYYFTNTTDKTNADLDLVMLTHGYRRFEWEPLLKNEYPPVTRQPEKALEISGIVNAPSRKPLDSGTVFLLSMHGGPVLSQDINKNGVFHFSDLNFTDNTSFVLKATNPKLKNNTRLVYNAPQPAAVTINENALAGQYDANKAMQAYLANKKLQQDETVKYGPLRGIMLKEVKIKNDDDYPSSSLAGPGFADQVIHRKDIQGNGLFSNQFSGRLIGIRIVDNHGSKAAILDMHVRFGPNPLMLVVLDGIEFPGSQFNLDDINVNDIETVEVLRGSSATIYGAKGGGGVLVITLRRGGIEPISSEIPDGLLPILPKGYYKARAFYAPKYDHAENSFNRPDLRSTIYWRPELVTDKDGNAFFDYYNADGTGSYRVVVEGIDVNGNLGRQVYRYKVD